MPQTNEHFASSPGGGKAGLWGVSVGGVNLLSSLEWVWVSLPSQSPALRCSFCHRPPTPLEQLCQPWHGSIAHILPAGLGGGISALSSWGRLIGPTAALQVPNLQQGGPGVCITRFVLLTRPQPSAKHEDVRAARSVPVAASVFWGL